MIRSIKNILLARLKKKSYALNQLDLKLLPYLNFQNGFFVEAGANDGISQSNTLYFERYLGWTGLLIEAIPVLAEACKRNRPRCLVENCALVASDYPGDVLEMRYCNLMSVVRGYMDITEEEAYVQSGLQFLRAGEEPYIVSVPAKTLTEILEKHHIGHVDLLSLDVEGYEPEVLRGINFDLCAPRFILIEAWHKKKADIEMLLRNRYEQVNVLDSTSDYSNILYRVK